MDAWLQEMAGLAATGLAAGFLSTLFGVGGGLVVVPILHYAIGFGFVEATALSLLAMALQTPVGMWTHARRGAVDWRLGGWLALGGLGGVLVGAQLQPMLPVPWLKLAFAAVMVLAAWRLWARLVQGEPRRIDWMGLVLLGLAAGTVSRLLGVGGGLVTVPALVLLGTRIHTAVATSLVPVFSNAAIASAGILALGTVDPRLALPIALGAVVAAPLGTWAAHALHADHLRRIFAVALALAAVYVAATSGALSL